MTLFDAGKNHIPDGSATVGQLEIFTLIHQPKLGTICVQLV